MTTVDYEHNKNTFELKVMGHAGYNPGGPDIVCAACSTLAYTLWDSMLEQQDTGMLEELNAKQKDGAFTLKAVCKAGCDVQITVIFNVIMRGFAMIAQKYPEFCRISGQKQGEMRPQSCISYLQTRGKDLRDGGKDR